MYFIPSNQRFVTLFIKTFPLCSVNGLNPRVTLKCVVNGSLWHGKRFKSAGGFAQCESTSHSMTSFIKFVYFLLIVYNFCHLKMTPIWPRTKLFVNFVINFISFPFTSANYFYFCFWAFTFFQQKKIFQSLVQDLQLTLTIPFRRQIHPHPPTYRYILSSWHLFGKAIFTVVIINATIYLVHFIIIYKIFGFIYWVDKVNWLHSTLAHTILYAVWSTAIYSVFNRCNHQSVELAGKYLNFPRSSIQIISKQID